MALIIEAGENLVNQRTGGEIGLDLVVQRHILHGGVHIIE